jgi:hypothetical protein
MAKKAWVSAAAIVVLAGITIPAWAQYEQFTRYPARDKELERLVHNHVPRDLLLTEKTRIEEELSQCWWLVLVLVGVAGAIAEACSHWTGEDPQRHPQSAARDGVLLGANGKGGIWRRRGCL